MAIKMDFSSSRNALQRLSQFMQYDQLNKRASARQQVELNLADTLARGRQTEGFQQDVTLEGYKSSNRMAEAKQAAILAISQQPKMDALISYVNLGRNNMLGPEEEPIYKKSVQLLSDIIDNVGKVGIAVVNGTATAEHLSAAAEAGGNKAWEWTTKELGTNLRAHEEIRVRDRANEIDKIKAGTASLQESKTYPDWFKSQQKMIDEASDFVTSQKISTKAGSIPSINDFFTGAGLSQLASLPGELQGKLLQGLAQIKQDISRPGAEKEMSPGQYKFVQGAKNAFWLTGGDRNVTGTGNLPDPNTGLSATTEQQVADEAKTNSILHYRNVGYQRMVEADAVAAQAQNRPPRDWGTNPITSIEETRLQNAAQDWYDIISGKTEEQKRIVKEGMGFPLAINRPGQNKSTGAEVLRKR